MSSNEATSETNNILDVTTENTLAPLELMDVLPIAIDSSHLHTQAHTGASSLPVEGMSPFETSKEDEQHVNGKEEANFQIFKGMEFDSMEAVEEYYKAFAKQRGFGVRKRTTKSKEKGSEKKVSCSWVCGRAGEQRVKTPVVEVEGQLRGDIEGQLGVHKRKRQRARSTSAFGCSAGLRTSFQENKQKWVIVSFSELHNHTMVSPKSVGFMRCHRAMPAAAKCLVETFEENRVPTGLVAGMFGGGDAPITNRDCWNHSRDLRLKNLDLGDAEAVLQYCKRKQAENPNFFYSIQPDKDDRMVNFLWIDAKARQYYEYFGDVISFDTTYKTNKYNMPFALFIGVNHHGQSIVLGCALLQDEGELTFRWLFETWLQAMHDKAPTTILTDQDQAMANAIAKIFPNTRHRLCVWHITSKFPSKLKLYSDESKFGYEMKECIWKSVTIEEFRSRWDAIQEKYNLDGNDWFKGLFHIRKSWVSVYNKDTFSAGMNTTQRSESMNAIFDSYYDKSTTLRDFVSKYDKAMESRYTQERKEDFFSRHLLPIMRLHSVMEKQAADVYTRAAFNWFWEELANKDNFVKKKLNKVNNVMRYEVSNCVKSREMFIVSINLETLVGECQCHLFENKGILCRHMLAVLHSKGIREIPDHYILYRWRKEANSGIQCPINRGVDENLSGAVRTATSEQAYTKIMDTLLPLWKEIALMSTNEKSVENQPQEVLETHLLQAGSSIPKGILHDPCVSKTKGRPKVPLEESRNGRFKSRLEVAIGHVLKNRKCGICKLVGHDRRNCPRSKVAVLSNENQPR